MDLRMGNVVGIYDDDVTDSISWPAKDVIQTK